MKFKSTIIASVIFTAAASLTGCESAEKNATNVDQADAAFVDRSETTVEPSSAQSADASKAEFESFRMETDKIIAQNEAKMVELKAKMREKKEDVRAQYEKDLEALRIENEKLKNDMNDFAAGTNDNWESFKAGVNRDIDRLGKSISALADKSDND